MSRPSSGVMQWRPSREQSWWLFMVTVLAAVAAAVLNLWRGFSWAPWIPAAVAAVLALVVARLQGAAKRRDERGAVLLGSTSTADPDGRLETVREVPLQRMGVHREHVTVRYLHRDAEARLLELLTAGQPVLVVGNSMAGKTRMSAEVLREHFPHYAIVRPSPPDGLSKLMAGQAQPSGTVVWLDDLDHYLTGDGCRVEWLDRMVDAGNLAVATIRSNEYDRHHGDEQTRQPHDFVLERFEIVRLHPNDADERRRLAAQTGRHEVCVGIVKYGLGEYVGGGYLATQRLDNADTAPPRGHPMGVAVVLAAVDWRRLGLEAIPAATLAELAPKYLSERYRPDSGEDITAALAWASQLIDDTVRLLEPTEDRSAFTAPDYIVDHLTADGTRPPARVPEYTWRASLDAVPPERRTTLAFTAHREGRLPDAKTLWRQVSEDPSHPADAPIAALCLGAALYEVNDSREAEKFWRQAADSGHPDVAPRADLNLGVLLRKLDKPPEAEQFWRRAVKSGHPDVAPEAELNLGVLLRELGHRRKAVASLRRAAKSGHPNVAPKAAFTLGNLLYEFGRPKKAEGPLRQATESGHPDVAPEAGFNLGNLLCELGRRDDAVEPWRLAATYQSEAGHRAGFNLGNLLCELGRRDDAVEPWRLVAAGRFAVAPKAACNLGNVMYDLGEIEKAEMFWRQAVASGHPEAAPKAAFHLGNLLAYRLGRPKKAEKPWRLAAASKYPDIAPDAALNLGILLREQGRLPESKKYLQQAVKSDHPTAAHQAAFYLNTRLHKRHSCDKDAPSSRPDEGE